MRERSTGHVRRQSLRLPTGTETMHLREAARHRRITRILEDTFEMWGYTPIETPVVDFFDVYRPLLEAGATRDWYRAVDRQGEILAVRADTTLFLAKQLGLHLSSEELPVRVWYNDQIVRAEGEDEIAGNEYQQAGIELVGPTGVEADAEILTILQEALGALDLGDAAIHLGSHAILTAIAGVRGITTNREQFNREQFNREHNREQFRELRGAVRQRSATYPGGLTADEAALLRFIGTPEEFSRALEGWTLEKPVRAAAQDLLECVGSVQVTQDKPSFPAIRIDTSELCSQGYYTGIAFAAYHPDSTAAIARGGRYDDLLGHFGCEAPSVGFSMFTRKFPAATKHSETPAIARAPEGDFAARLSTVRGAHARGERMSL